MLLTNFKFKSWIEVFISYVTRKKLTQSYLTKDLTNGISQNISFDINIVF